METTTRPFDVDTSEYPFKDRWLPYRDGYVHYVDEGQGPAVLLLHGNPTWSYIYRNVIKDLRGECRLVAPDYPGFGVSKAPIQYGFTPREHSEVVADLIDRLQLKNVVLVVYDWGGPIGTNYAVRNRANLRGLVVMNTWAWPASFRQTLFSIAMGGWPLGYGFKRRKTTSPSPCCQMVSAIRRKSRKVLERPTPIRFRLQNHENRRGFSLGRFAKLDHGSPRLNPD